MIIYKRRSSRNNCIGVATRADMDYPKALFVFSTLVVADHSMLDIAHLSHIGGFESQVEYIVESVRTELNVTAICADLETALQKSWPGSTVKPYGSLAAGLGTPWSDVDCFVQAPRAQALGTDTADGMRQILLNQTELFTALESVATTRVPKLKCIHVPTGKECDVTFTKPAAVRNTQLIAYFLKLDRRASTLAYIVKCWSKLHHLTGQSLMPSYTMTLLVIFYLQLSQVLPAVTELQENRYFMVEHWNTAIDTRLDYHSPNTASFYKLLGGFFTYYSYFRFDKFIVAPFTGRAEDKYLFDNISHVPEEYRLYKHNVWTNKSDTFNTTCSICVQDPFVHGRNQAGAVCPELAHKIISLFRFAANMYKEKTSRDFLTSILETHRSQARHKVICRHIAGTDLG